MAVILEAVGVFLGTSHFLGAMVFLILIWVAFLVGVAIGWVWKPSWAPGLTQLGSLISSSAAAAAAHKLVDSSPSRCPASPLKGFGSAPCVTSFLLSSPNLVDTTSSLAVNRSQFGDSRVIVVISNRGPAQSTSSSSSSSITPVSSKSK